MGAREPAWWYAPAPSVTALMLAPVGALYGALTARRMAETPRYRAKIPVICVGNFTAGGTGKTPLVRALLILLGDLGHRPVVLSRGYGGRITGPHWIDRTSDRAAEVGDEPLLLAADAPVMVARDRAAGAQAIEAQHSRDRATVIVMDDGLQNPALAKDLSIAVVDVARGLGNGRCIPAGPLRAPVATQLARVQAVVLNGGAANTTPAASLARLLTQSNIPLLTAHIGIAGPQDWLTQAPVVAYAGIGVPERFFQTLRGADAEIADAVPFPDHHRFSEADAQRLLARVDGTPLQLVTTEKDAVRLIGASGALAELARRSRTLPIAFDFDDANRAAFARLIAEHAALRA